MEGPQTTAAAIVICKFHPKARNTDATTAPAAHAATTIDPGFSS